MIAAFLLGISYGFSAGVSPGPLLGLVITQTLQKGWRAGNMVALAPLLSDLPIIVLAILLISHLPHAALGWLAIVGGLFVIYLGIETIRATWKTGMHTTETTEFSDAETKGSTYTILWRAALTNALNPHPYLFWSTVGAQVLLRIEQTSGVSGAIAFLVSFYVLLVGSKLLIALIVSRSRNWLRGRAYRNILISSGILLIGLGVFLLWEGISTL